jgi:hypothetical protein
MDGLHVEGAAEIERDVLPPAEIGQPISGEDALDSDDEIFAIGLDGCRKRLWAVSRVLVEQDLAVSIENAEVHGLGVKVDATVAAMGPGVGSHGPLLERLIVDAPTSLLRVE